MLLVLHSTLWYVYGDPRSEQPATRVASGPYAGLLTSEVKAAFLVDLRRSIERVCPTTGSRLFPGLPAAYLLSDRPPAALSPWSLQPRTEEGERLFQEFYSDPENQPSCVALLAGSPMSQAESTLLESYEVRYSMAYPDSGEIQIYTR